MARRASSRGWTLDPTFGTGGIVTLPMGFQGYFDFDVFYGFRGGLVADPSGRLVALGSGTFGPPFSLSWSSCGTFPTARSIGRSATAVGRRCAESTTLHRARYCSIDFAAGKGCSATSDRLTCRK